MKTLSQTRNRSCRPFSVEDHISINIHSRFSESSILRSSLLDAESETKDVEFKKFQANELNDKGIMESLGKEIASESKLNLINEGDREMKNSPIRSVPIISNLWQCRLMVLFAAALYGTNFTAVKILDENIPTSVGPVLRFTLAALITSPFLLFGKKNDRTIQDDLKSSSNSRISGFDESYGAIIGGLEIGMWNTIGYLSQAKALESVPASVCAFICSLAVVTVPFLDFLSGKQISSRKLIGAGIAVLGVAFLELDGLSAGVSEGSSIVSPGTLFSLVQPFAFGMGFWRMEYYTRRHPWDGMKVTVSQVACIAILSFLTLIISTGTQGIPDVLQIQAWLSNPTILLAILWTGSITTALTIFIETQALKTLSAAETTLLYSFEPLFGALFASLVLGETFGIGGYSGATLVLVGCLFSNISEQKQDVNSAI